MTPAAPVPQHGPHALHPGFSSLPNETLLLVFQKLSIGDIVRYAAVCRSWRSLLRSSACWADVPLKVALCNEIWDHETRTLKMDPRAIVDALQCQLACGLRHATALEIVSEGAAPSQRRQDAFYDIVHSLFHSLSTSPHPPLTVESLKLADIVPDRKLCEALAPHCQHVKTLHFTYPRSMLSAKPLPSLMHLLEACPLLQEISVGAYQDEILTPLREIADFAHSRSRPYRCVHEQPSESFPPTSFDEEHVTQLLPWLGSMRFNLLQPLNRPFTAPVPGIRCHLTLFGGLSVLLPDLSRHLDQCQAAYHAIIASYGLPSAVLEAIIMSAPSVRELHSFSPTPQMHSRSFPHIRRFSHDSMSQEALRRLSVACPNLSCLSAFLIVMDSSSTVTITSEKFLSFPSLTHLLLTTRNSVLASHIASTSRSLTHLTLNCPKASDTFFEAAFALPFLTSLKIHIGGNWDRYHDDDRSSRDECTDTKAATCSSVTPGTVTPDAPVVPCAGARLKHLHLHIFSTDEKIPDCGPLCVLLDNSGATLESLHLSVNSLTWMLPVVDVLMAGRFARLRLATMSVLEESITKLSARHPLCLWSGAPEMELLRWFTQRESRSQNNETETI